MSSSIVMYSTSWCPDCITAKTVLNSMQVTFRDINIEEDPEAAEKVMELNHGSRSVPTILFPDGSVLTEPGAVELRDKILELKLAS